MYGSHYSHLSPAEREELNRGLAQGLSLRVVASLLRRSPATLNREVRRNIAVTGYRACTAERRAKKRAALPRRLRFILLRPEVWKLIQDKLRLQWSPEQISSWLEESELSQWMIHKKTSSTMKDVFVLRILLSYLIPSLLASCLILSACVCAMFRTVAPAFSGCLSLFLMPCSNFSKA